MRQGTNALETPRIRTLAALSLSSFLSRDSEAGICKIFQIVPVPEVA
jgi:hypothetical protein